MATETFTPHNYEVQTLIDAVSTSTTSNAMSVQGAKKIALYVEQTNTGGTETGDFAVQVSLDGSNFVQLNRLLDNAATTAYVASKTLSADGSAVVFIDPKTLGIHQLKVDLTVTNSDTANFTAKVAVLT